jgi:hypothetical protein
MTEAIVSKQGQFLSTKKVRCSKDSNKKEFREVIKSIIILLFLDSYACPFFELSALTLQFIFIA